MAADTTNWVAGKLKAEASLATCDVVSDRIVAVRRNADSPLFMVAVLNVKDRAIVTGDVTPFLTEKPPSFFVNVPSKTLWTGGAIALVYSVPASFGTLGEVSKAANGASVSSYRNKDWGFFEGVIRQHTNVESVERVFGQVFMARRRRGPNLTIALVDAYNMSSEDVRNAYSTFGHFDIALKMTNYGSITSSAEETARSLGADALTLKGLMARLAKS